MLPYNQNLTLSMVGCYLIESLIWVYNSTGAVQVPRISYDSGFSKSQKPILPN